MKEELKNIEPRDKVGFPGWIPHDKLPEYLNELKVIVSPSFSEGGVPALILEAMACGTIVLVTSVAGVDIIKDGENGFVLKDNLPESIAEKVIEVLGHPKPEKVVNGALGLVKEKYSYEKMVAQFKNMLYE